MPPLHQTHHPARVQLCCVLKLRSPVLLLSCSFTFTIPLHSLSCRRAPKGIAAVCGGSVTSMRLPRVRAEEVGFGAQGRRLGMPQRPNWRGVVRGWGGVG